MERHRELVYIYNTFLVLPPGSAKLFCSGDLISCHIPSVAAVTRTLFGVELAASTAGPPGRKGDISRPICDRISAAQWLRWKQRCVTNDNGINLFAKISCQIALFCYIPAAKWRYCNFYQRRGSDWSPAPFILEPFIAIMVDKQGWLDSRRRGTGPRHGSARGSRNLVTAPDW